MNRLGLILGFLIVTVISFIVLNIENIKPVTPKQPQDLSQKPILFKNWASGSQQTDLREPQKVLVTANVIYVTDKKNRRLQVFDLDGDPMMAVDNSTLGKGNLLYPNGLGLLPNGNLLLGDSQSGYMWELLPTGKLIKVWLNPDQGIKPGEITVSPEGKVLVVDQKSRNLVLFDEEGRLLKVITVDELELEAPQGIAFAKDGSFWVTDAKHGKLTRLTMEGNVLTGGAQSLGTSYSMLGDIAVDSLGRILITDTMGGQLLVFSPEGDKLLFSVGGFSLPTGVDVDSNGRIFVVDRGSDHINVLGY